MIQAGSIIVDKLAANSITAEKINVNSIRAAVLTAEAISSLNITTGNLTVTNGAKIGNWYIENGKIVSQTGNRDKIVLNASGNRIDGVSYEDNEYSAFNLSPHGFLCNSAKTSCLPGSTGIDAKGAIVAYGYGNVRKDGFGNKAFLTGIYGRANNSNQNPAPTYGGYFQRLRANGLHVSVNRSTGGSISMDTTFTAADYTNYDPTYNLPPKPYEGQILFFTTYNKAVRVNGNGHSVLFGAQKLNQIHIPGACRMCVFIFDGSYWRFGRMEAT
ncbi:hypothetical protein IX324_003014 [Bacteroides pyogenes]|nr:hypothetical protein [Bacteroides pyogenes]